MNKKAVELSMNVVIIAIILLIVAVLVIYAVTRLLGQQTGIIGGDINGSTDPDQDGIPNLFDKCPCQYGTREFQGCPTAETLASSASAVKTC